MKEALASRLETLRAEHIKGAQRLRELQAQQVDVEQTILRIEGAITVLQELVGVQANADIDPSGHAAGTGSSDNLRSG